MYPLTIAGLGVVGAVGATVLSGSTYLNGIFVGVMLTVIAALLVVVPVIGSGSLSHLWGLSGESATAAQLGRRRHRRQGWMTVHGLVFNGTDVDHVAIGPGGVLVVETKWVSSHPWKIVGDRIDGPVRDPLQQARRNAARVGNVLADPRRGGMQVEVHPSVVVWGPGMPVVAEGHDVVGGVLVFTGGEIGRLHAWLDQRRLEPEVVQRLQTLLTDFAEQQLRLGR